MRLLRSPITQFLLIGFLTVAAIVVGINVLADRAASDEAIQEARGTTEVLARSVAQPDLPARLVAGRPGAIDRFDRSVLKRLLVGDVQHVNIRAADGRIIYSDRTYLIGQQYPLAQDKQQVLADGGTGSVQADPEAAADSSTDGTSGMVQIYTSIQTRKGQPLLFEAFYTLDQIEARSAQIYSAFRWISVAPLLLLILVVTLMLRVLSAQLTSAAKERERLLRSAIDASEAERRRIARDLHDGVVQDLAGVAFSVSALSRDPVTPAGPRATLAVAGGALRGSLKALRSLVAEIHPPDLHADGLAAALADLIAPAGSVGMQASVSVEGTESASRDTAALIWRVAQEAVRNAIRHSQASTLAVTVRGENGRICLEVVDDGVGFDPVATTDPSSYGLRGLRTLVADSGGELTVHSSPGEGTEVRMEVDAQ